MCIYISPVTNDTAAGAATPLRRRAAAVSEAEEWAIFSRSILDIGFLCSLPSFALVGINNDDDDVALCSAVVCGRERVCVCVCGCVCVCV